MNQDEDEDDDGWEFKSAERKIGNESLNDKIQTPKHGNGAVGVGADVKASIVSEVAAQSSEPSAASTSLSTLPANIFTFGNISSQNNGSTASSPTLSSPFLPVGFK